MIKRIVIIQILSLFAFTNITAQKSPKRILSNYRKAIAEFKSDEKGFNATITGAFQIGDIKDLPITIHYLDGMMRMEMNFMGAQVIQIGRDSVSWSIDPFSKTYEFEDYNGASGALGVELNSKDQISKLISEGWQASSSKVSKLDSIEVYEVLFENEEDESDFVGYFSKDEYYYLGYSQMGLSDFFMNYTEVNGYLLPTLFMNLGGESGDIIMHVDEYDFESAIPDSLFQMTKEAKEAYQEYLKPKVNLVQQYYDEGSEAMKAGNYDEAIELFNKGLERNPNDVLTLNSRGLSKTYSGDHYGAIADISKAIEQSDEPNPKFYNNLGLSKMRLGDKSAAKKDFEQSLALDSTYHVALSNLSLLLLRMEEYESAYSFAQSALKYDSTRTTYIYYRAVTSAQLGMYSEAMEFYQKAGEMGFDLAEYHNYRGVSEYQLAKYDDALSSFKVAANKDSTNTQYLKNIANTYKKMESGYSKAADIYTLLIEKDSLSSEFHAERALVFYEMSLFKGALRDINKAISLYDKNALYFDYRAYIKEYLGDYTGAIEDFTLSLNLEQDPNIYFRRGSAKINISNKFDGCKDFKKASELGNEDAKKALEENCKL